MATGPFVQTRRQFLGASAAVAAAVASGLEQLVAEETDRERALAEAARPVNLGIVGCGGEGTWLMSNVLNVPGVEFKAICDIWPHSRNVAKNILDNFKQPAPREYTEYAQFLDDAKDIEAVIVAVPDWKHAEVSNACLRAGKHVYCEKEMDKTIEGARTMVRTARETKKILQIGHQRHSNPLYKLAWKLLHHDRVCGRVTHARGQFNRNWNGRRPVDPSGREDFDCQTWGYETMAHLRDWRLYKKHGGGWMADLGSHQVDVFSWMLDAPPLSVMGCGGVDYYADETFEEEREPGRRVAKPYPPREWYDNVLCLFEYPDRAAGKGSVRIHYQVITTNAFDEFYEVFFGTEGTLFLCSDGGMIFREPGARKLAWEIEAVRAPVMGLEGIQTGVGRTLPIEGRIRFLRSQDPGERLRPEPTKTEHQHSLEDFIHGVRTGIRGGCSPEMGLVTTVACIKASEAAEKKEKIVFQPGDFVA